MPTTTRVRMWGRRRGGRGHAACVGPRVEREDVMGMRDTSFCHAPFLSCPGLTGAPSKLRSVGDYWVARSSRAMTKGRVVELGKGNLDMAIPPRVSGFFRDPHGFFPLGGGKGCGRHFCPAPGGRPGEGRPRKKWWRVAAPPARLLTLCRASVLTVEGRKAPKGPSGVMRMHTPVLLPARRLPGPRVEEVRTSSPPRAPPPAPPGSSP